MPLKVKTTETDELIACSTGMAENCGCSHLFAENSAHIPLRAQGNLKTFWAALPPSPASHQRMEVR